MHLSPPGGLGCCPFSGGGSVVVDFFFIVTPILGVCNRSMFCCTLLYVHSSIAIILMGKRGLVALLNMSFWCFVIVEWLTPGFDCPTLECSKLQLRLDVKFSCISILNNFRILRNVVTYVISIKSS